MTDRVRKLVLASTILAIAIILVIFEIPFFGTTLAIELSLVPILIGRRYIGYWNTVLIIFIYPWFSVFYSSGSWVGSIFLFLQGIGAITLDKMFNNKKYSFFGVLFVLLLITIWSALLNMFLIAPLYTIVLGGEQYTMKLLLQWMVISLLFNPIKFVIIYAITWGLWIGLENSVNQEPNY